MSPKQPLDPDRLLEELDALIGSPRSATERAHEGSTDASGRSTTIALTASPHFSSGTPITATSATAGCENRASSVSIDDTFSPPEMITSFLRSEMVT